MKVNQYVITKMHQISHSTELPASDNRLLLLMQLLFLYILSHH